MRKLIYNLKQQPEGIRRNIVHIAVFVFAGFMLSLFVWSLGNRFSGGETQAQLKESLKPFSSFKDSVLGTGQGTSNAIYPLRDKNKNKSE